MTTHHRFRVTVRVARTVYYTAMTLDGFLATEDHSLDWLLAHEAGSDGPLDYEPFIAGVGALCMGSHTYEWIHGASRGPGGEIVEPWGYEHPCWVFTHRQLPGWEGADVRFTAAPVPAVHAEMVAAAGGRDRWIVGGGDLAGQFHDHGLLDEVVVNIAPATIGRGQPLLPRRVELELLQTAHSGEFVAARFRVLR